MSIQCKTNDWFISVAIEGKANEHKQSVHAPNLQHPPSEHLLLSCICVKNRYWGSAPFWQSSKPDWCGRRSFIGVKSGCTSDVLPTRCTVHDSDTHLQHSLVSRKLGQRELPQYQMGWWTQRLLEGHKENADISEMIWVRVKTAVVSDWTWVVATECWFFI